ncbi:MAG: glycoside hydrolase family 105 protein [bacterium]
MKSILILVLNLILVVSCARKKAGESEPIPIVRTVADKIIRETAFDFERAPQKTVLGVQIVDFQQLFGEQAAGVGYALNHINSDNDTTVQFGLSHSGNLKIWLNGQEVFQQAGERVPHFTEIAYNKIVFQDTMTLSLQKGQNPILVKCVSNPQHWVFFLRPTKADGELERSVRFLSDPEKKSEAWLCTGPFPPQGGDALKSVFPPEEAIKPFYVFGNEKYVWRHLPHNYLAQLLIKPGNSYQRESYLEWHYANGATMLTLLQLGDATGDKKYVDFVARFCEFTLVNQDYFRWQYETLHALRGSYHRLFRRIMLDDTGAPALPFLEMQLRNPDQRYREFIMPIADYIRQEQVRLPDGTFCRPEPTPMTVWADDLFMSVPFLLRMAKLTGDARYFDDVAKQILHFNSYLFNPEKGLFNHGWFSSTQQTSTVYWGRANGWIVWAVSEALRLLPETHAVYDKIKTLFQEHLAGLLRYQNERGMWHQVLDHPQSYEETSCTAMFTLAMARGVRNGWLDDSYRAPALKAWQALTQKIAADGTVRGICRGTGIGEDLEFYFKRQTFDHDPRGLGAVMTAGMEIAKLTDLSK